MPFLIRPFFAGVMIVSIFAGIMWSCAYTEKIKDGQTAFERKQYAVAIPMLAKSFERAKRKTEQGQIAFLLGECYRRTNKPTEAIDWYRTAFDYQYGLEALKQHALALKENGQYREAIDAFRELGFELGSPYEYRREINSCERAIEWTAAKDEKTVRVLPSPANTPSAEYAPAVYAKNLVFVSDRPASLGDDMYPWTGRDYSDLFFLEDDMALPFPSPLNSEFNEGPASFSADGKEIFLTRCSSPGKFEDGFCKIWHSTLIDGQWEEPEPLSFQEEGVNYGHPSLSSDGTTLYFSSNHPNGWGGYDIYQVVRSTGGIWSEPTLMSRSINSQENEQFPRIDSDTLYFASDGHTGMGGLDVFSSFRFQDDWTPAYNLRPPVNSSSDDFGYIIDSRGSDVGQDVLKRAWISSSRPGGQGDDDLWMIENVRLEEPPEEPPVTESVEYSMTLNVYVLEKIFLDPADPNSRVLGRKPLSDVTLVMNRNGIDTTIFPGPDGWVRIELGRDENFTFSASKPGYLTASEPFSTVGIALDPRMPEQVFELEVELDKIFVDQEIVLENIYYDFDEWYIREDARPTLLSLATVLKENPDIRIQLSSHTDCRGGARYNEDLSQKRAQSAVDFLIQSGIRSDRLEAVGYGESVPAVNCVCAQCTEEEHQANRRTTFKVLE